MSQKMLGKDAETVDYSETFPVKKYYRIETYTHFLERAEDKISSVKLKVQELKDEKKFVKADKIAEALIRGGTKPNRKATEKLSRKDLVKDYQEAMNFFKERIFGYTELTKEELASDVSDDKKKKSSLPMPKSQKELEGFAEETVDEIDETLEKDPDAEENDASDEDAYDSEMRKEDHALAEKKEKKPKKSKATKKRK